MSFVLNRYKYLDKIDNNTPIDVIEFMLKTTGRCLDKEKIKEKMDKILKHFITYDSCFEKKEEFTEEDLQKLILFVSDKDQDWKVENLLKSFYSLIEFHENPYIEINSIGSRTNEDPFSFDIVMLYHLCLELSISTTKDDNLDTLYAKIKKVYKSRSELINIVKNKVSGLNKLDLLKIEKMKNDYEEEEEDLFELSKKINMNYIITRSLLTKSEAVVYCSRFFNIDITKSDDPIRTLNLLTETKDMMIHSSDIFDGFTKNYNINPYYFRMDKVWRKKLKEIYTSKCFANLKKYCGVETEEQLESHFDKDTFFEGDMNFLNPDCKNIISYGNLKENNFESISVTILTQKFQQNKDFGKYSNSISKLLNICEDNNLDSLKTEILDIKKYYTVMDENIKKCKELYTDNKTYFDIILDKLQEISDMLKDKKKLDDLDAISFNNTKDELVNHFTSNQDTRVREVVVKLPIINYKNSIFVKATENYYTYLVEDLVSLKNMKEKPEEFLKMKCDQYLYTSIYYKYILLNEKPSQLK